MGSAGLDRAASERAHEMRIVMECVSRPGTAGDGLAEVLAGRLAHWLVTPLVGDEDQIWVVAGQASDRVGTDRYVRTAHTLVQEILDLGTVSRAEADLPIRPRGAETQSRPAGPVDAEYCPPGSDVQSWAREAIRCDEAWVIPAPPDGSGLGGGVLVGHPDTGYTLHPNLGVEALDLTRDLDVIDDDDDARDPLVAADSSPWPLAHPGHGTGTASIIVGRGTEPAGIVGVAPEAVLVPIRAVESPVQLFDTDVARSVEHARSIGCQVVSMSLGGKGFFGLQRAIQRAVDAGMIVMAAAGNEVGIVVAPASYPNCLAVAATGVGDRPWPESSRGRRVDVSAPGWCVWIAGFRWEASGPVTAVLQASGTSYAVAHVAGVAALWFAHHGSDALRVRFGSKVQAAFLQVLRSGGARVPSGWDATAWGAGIVDAAAMIAAPLPTATEVSGTGPAEATPLERLSALVDTDEAAFGDAVSRRLGVSGTDLNRAVSRFEGELAFHLLTDPGFRAHLLSGTADSGYDAAGTLSTSSPGFAERFL
jgi:hypothetical protein